MQMGRSVPAPVVVETRNYSGEQKNEGHGNSGGSRELTRKALIVGTLSIILIALVTLFLFLTLQFTQEYFGSEGVRSLAKILGWGFLIFVAVGSLQFIMWMNTAQVIRVHAQTIAGIVHFQKMDDLGEIARTHANNGSELSVLPSVLNAISAANGNARQGAQEIVREARYLTDKQGKNIGTDTQAFLSQLAQMPQGQVIDLE